MYTSTMTPHWHTLEQTCIEKYPITKANHGWDKYAHSNLKIYIQRTFHSQFYILQICPTYVRKYVHVTIQIYILWTHSVFSVIHTSEFRYVRKLQVDMSIITIEIYKLQTNSSTSYKWDKILIYSMFQTKKKQIFITSAVIHYKFRKPKKGWNLTFVQQIDREGTKKKWVLTITCCAWTC